MNIPVPPAMDRCRRLPLLSRLAWLAALAIALLPSLSAAQSASCWITFPPNIAFGSVDPSGATATGNLGYQCAKSIPETVNMRICLFMNPMNPPGVAPRQMLIDWPVSYLDYDLFADPAHTRIIGSEASGHPVYSTVLTVQGTDQPTGDMPLYARVPAGQTVAPGFYVSRNTVILRTAFASDGSTPGDAECAAGSLQTNYAEITAQFANACYISTATDLDFGTVTDLDGARSQTSTISLNCPDQTAWRVALDYGSNASGTDRRLSGPGGLLSYQLYQDAGHSRPWGNTTSDDVVGTGNNQIQTLTVHGHIPAQAVAAPGTYSDRITITLTY